jgi:hypothetical protein
VGVGSISGLIFVAVALMSVMSIRTILLGFTLFLLGLIAIRFVFVAF